MADAAPAIYNESGNITNLVPAAEVPALVAAMIAAVPPDTKPTPPFPSIQVSWVPGSPGMLSVAATLGGEMTQADIVTLLNALIKAEPEKAVLQSCRLAVDIKTA